MVLEIDNIYEINMRELETCKKEIKLYKKILETKIYQGIFTKKEIEETIKYFKDNLYYLEKDLEKYKKEE